MKAGEAERALVAGHAASIRVYMGPNYDLELKEPEKIIALAQEAQRLLPAEEKAIRSVNALKVGHGYLALADFEAVFDLSSRRSAEPTASLLRPVISPDP